MNAIIRNMAVMVAVLAAARCFAESEPPSQVPNKYDQPLGDFKQSQAKAGMEVAIISKSTRESLGVSTDGGAVVERVEKDGPADKARLKERDVIISICGVMISSQMNFNYALNKAYIEDCNAIPVTVLRSGTIEAFTMRIPGPPRVDKPRESSAKQAPAPPRPDTPKTHMERMPGQASTSPRPNTTVSQHSYSYWKSDDRWGWDHLTYGPVEIGGGVALPLICVAGGAIIPIAMAYDTDEWKILPLTAPIGLVAGPIVGAGLGCVGMVYGLCDTFTGGAFVEKPEPLRPLGELMVMFGLVPMR